VTSRTISILDLAAVGPGESISDSFAGSVALARLAENGGYTRIWYAEHHNIRSIASSATAVLIAHIAAHTDTIRLGSGGIMLPNHSPLVIAEQFGTLASLHPGRIDLGLGRAPGSDQQTTYALRRDPAVAEHFPQDVVELQGLLSDESPIPGVKAIPGQGTHVPLYILGSSLFGARLAAVLGLPYGFASHFAPQALHPAIRLYREQFQPSAQLAEPYVIAGVNVIAADTEDEARRLEDHSKRARVRSLFSRGERRLTDDEVESILHSPQAAHVEQMMQYRAVGEPDAVVAYLDDFRRATGADELITVHHGDGVDSRLRSVELLAEAADLRGGAVPTPSGAISTPTAS
jgi:luciferase family oxidoreductase group 1